MESEKIFDAVLLALMFFAMIFIVADFARGFCAGCGISEFWAVIPMALWICYGSRWMKYLLRKN